MVGMGLSTQQIYVNVRVGSFATYLIKADAPLRVDGPAVGVIQAPKTGASNHALPTQRLRMDRHQADAAEQAAWRSACK